MTAGAGAAGVKIHTLGAVVSGSTFSKVGGFTASTDFHLIGNDFSLPTDGYYIVGFVKTGTISTSCFMEFLADLQLHYA